MQRGGGGTEFAFLWDIRLNELSCFSRIVGIKKKAHPLGCAFSIKIHFLITSLVLPSLVQPLAQRL
jgi:hypothetical protein